MQTRVSLYRVSSHMSRAIAAIFAAPLFAGLLFGFYAIFAVPVMLAVTAVVALPTFMVLRRIGWLQWWHALSVGTVCGGLVAVYYVATSPAYHVEYIGARNAFFFVGLGAAVGLAFWWIGIFRNPAFPTVASKRPLSMLLLVPVAGIGAWAYLGMEPHFVEGRVLRVLHEPQRDIEHSGLVQMRLSSGITVQSRIPIGSDYANSVGRCFVMSERRAFTQLENVYFIHSPKFGDRADDC